MSRLFTVRLEVEVVVVAEHNGAAKRTALANLREMDHEHWHTDASPTTTLPSQWDKNSLPYGGGVNGIPEKTVGEWLADVP